MSFFRHKDGTGSGAATAGELGHTQFGSLINKIKAQKPDAVYAIVVGGSNVSFYKQLIERVLVDLIIPLDYDYNIVQL